VSRVVSTEISVYYVFDTRLWQVCGRRDRARLLTALVCFSSMAYDSKAIANYFLDRGEKSGKKLDPMQLQKLVYFAHGWHLAVDDSPLIDEMVEAWRYGPVIPTLYHEFKSFGKNQITRKACNLRLVKEEEYEFVEPSLGDGEGTSKARRLLDLIWNAYSKLTGIQLSNLTHIPGSPWYITWQRAEGRKNVDIPDELIRDYFRSQLDAV
jgi:uncharacterized phage-associated protein